MDLKDENKTLKDEIEILKNAHQQEHNGRMADNDEEEERVDKICSALGLFDATDGFTYPETNAAIVDAIKTLKDENTKLKITMKRISLLVAEQELDALKQ